MAKCSESSYKMVEEIVDLESAEEFFVFRFRCDGLPDEEDCTWNPVQQLYEDVPEILNTFLENCKKKIGQAGIPPASNLSPLPVQAHVRVLGGNLVLQWHVCRRFGTRTAKHNIQRECTQIHVVTVNPYTDSGSRILTHATSARR